MENILLVPRPRSQMLPGQNKVALLVCALAFILSFGMLGCSRDAASDGEMQEARSANQRAVGESAADFLTDTRYRFLRFQFAYDQGTYPTGEATDNLRKFIAERTHKTVLFETKDVIVPWSGKEWLGLQDIARIEDENRTLYNQGDTLALYIYFTALRNEAERFGENITVLGTSYRNTSIVIHEWTIKDRASRYPEVSTADLETATLLHEFCHLLGLVNLGAPMVKPHEDPFSFNHCDEAFCLMQARLLFDGESTGAFQNSAATGTGGINYPLGPECIRDLVALGGRPVQ